MSHKWHFFRAGGVEQVSLRSGDDLLALPELDQKLWLALAMPTTGVNVAPRTLELLDRDRDGTIRVTDILDAVAWIGATWKSADDVLKGSDTLPLAALADEQVKAAARRVLADLKKPDATTISVAEAAGAAAAFDASLLNGDGVIVPASTEDADLRRTIEEAIAGAGATPDRSGMPGLDRAHADTFFADVDKLAAWFQAGGAHRVLGDDTAAAADALAAVQTKLEDYFARARLAAFDPRAVAAVNGQEADLVALGGGVLSAASEDIARLPLARVEPGRALPLRGAVNPAWAARLETFADRAVQPILGKRDVLTGEDLATIVAKLADYVAWRAGRPPTSADALDRARVEELAAGEQRARIAALIAADETHAGERDGIASVERAAHLQRDFGRVLRNFVNFSDFYSRRDGAFQAGTLYLDGRAFKLVVPVSDAAKHGTLAPMSSSYLAYCDVVRAGVKKSIAVAVTNGDADNLFVGRNGVFYDRDGADWNATITKLIANPISVRAAFWSPYKKLIRLIEEQISKRAADADTRSQGRIQSAAVGVATIDQKQAPAPPPPPADPAAKAPPAKKGLDVGVIAIVSLAIGAVVGAIGGLVVLLVGMGIWMPLGMLGLLLAISGPSMLMAWMKLRQRNLGPLLDANGWAINARARVNVAFGAALTDLAAVPKGSGRSMDDPFADRRRPWKLYLFLVVVLVLAGTWYAGRLDRYLPLWVKSGHVLGKHAPINNP